jgi:hypothetical protein
VVRDPICMGAAGPEPHHNLGVDHDGLVLEAAERERYAGARSARTFLDFVVDGVSLYGLVRARRLDHISTLLIKPSMPAGAFRRQVEILTGRRHGDAPGGRVCIYVCPECGDIGCGALTVELRVGEDEVEWFDWRYENNYDATMSFDLEEFPRPCFDRKAYDRILEAAVSDYERDAAECRRTSAAAARRTKPGADAHSQTRAQIRVGDCEPGPQAGSQDRSP